jgi:UPF0755 protein
MKRIFFAVIVCMVLSWAWVWHMIAPVNAGQNAPIAISIAKGDSVAVIADRLEELGLIRSAWVFKLYARVSGKHTGLQAGRFTLSQSMSVQDMLQELTSGLSGEVSITIPEGWSVADIDSYLAAKGLGKPGELLDCAFTCAFSESTFLPKENFASREQRIGSRVEGYLFPDTYYVTVETYDPQAFMQRMLATFQKRIIDAHSAELQASGRTLHEAVTMASLVEEESRHDDERPVVAGILWKREEAGTLLGVDATVRYLLQKPTAVLTATDLDTDSPYNTRKRVGLPPGPIANAGESALVAAMRPKTTEYWYYLHGRDGVIRYARTNDEHNANKAKYLR